VLRVQGAGSSDRRLTVEITPVVSIQSSTQADTALMTPPQIPPHAPVCSFRPSLATRFLSGVTRFPTLVDCRDEGLKLRNVQRSHSIHVLRLHRWTS
jgi:hypothetical protein